MGRPPNGDLPSVSKTTGRRQLAICLDERYWQAIEATRRAHGLRSWSEAVRLMLDEALLHRASIGQRFLAGDSVESIAQADGVTTSEIESALRRRSVTR